MPRGGPRVGRDLIERRVSGDAKSGENRNVSKWLKKNQKEVIHKGSRMKQTNTNPKNSIAQLHTYWLFCPAYRSSITDHWWTDPKEEWVDKDRVGVDYSECDYDIGYNKTTHSPPCLSPSLPPFTRCPFFFLCRKTTRCTIVGGICPTSFCDRSSMFKRWGSRYKSVPVLFKGSVQKWFVQKGLNLQMWTGRPGVEF